MRSQIVAIENLDLLPQRAHLMRAWRSRYKHDVTKSCDMSHVASKALSPT